MITQFDLGGFLPMKLLSSVLSHVPDSLLDVEVLVRASGSPPFFTICPPFENPNLYTDKDENEIGEKVCLGGTCKGIWRDEENGKSTISLEIPFRMPTDAPFIEIAFPEKQFLYGFDVKITPANILAKIKITFSKTRKRLRICAKSSGSPILGGPLLIASSQNKIDFDLSIQKKMEGNREITVNGRNIDLISRSRSRTFSRQDEPVRSDKQLVESEKSPLIVHRSGKSKDHVMGKEPENMETSILGLLMMTTLVISAVGNILIIKYNLHNILMA